MKRNLTIVRTVLLLLCILVSAAAHGVAADEVQDRLNRFLHQTDTPGIALSVMRKGDSEPRSWYAGMGNLELQVPVDGNTTFRIGSVTKLFTAAGTMKLVKEGRLRLDTAMDKYFPDLQGAKQITVANLLGHSSGLPDMLFIEPFAGNMARPYTPEDILAMVIKKGSLNFEPGRKAEYCNTGYLVLGLLMEKITGRTYNDFLQSSIIGPLGVHRTEIGSDTAIVPWRAAGYMVQKSPSGKTQIVNAQYVSIIPPFSTGAIMSRPADFIRLIDMDGLLGDDTVKTMMDHGTAAHHTPVTISEGLGGLGLSIHYGMGFELLKFSDSDAVLAAKDGVIPGFCSWYVYFPDKKAAVAASTNNEKAVLPLLLLIREVAAGL